MQTQVEKLLQKLDKKPSSEEKSKEQAASQLVYPKDFLNRDDHSGLAVMFELNSINYFKDQVNVNTKGTLTSKNNKGVQNTEVEMQRKGVATNEASVRSSLPGYRKTGMSIILPPPDQWIENLNIAWTNFEFGALARNAELMSSVVNGDWGAAGQQVGAAAPGVLAKVAGKAGGNLAKAADGARRYVELMAGIRANDFSEVLFSNVNNRMHPFQFSFTPRNKEEAEAVHLILHRFKSHALPELFVSGGDNASYFRAPHTFDISFVDITTGNQTKYWTKISTCALVNCSINRTPNGGVAVIKDGSEYIPQTITLELQFTELTRLVRDSNNDPRDSY